MSVLVRFSPPSLTAEQYDAVLARLYEEGIQPAPGLELEVCFGSGDQMKVSVLFDSKEDLDAFGARLQPILTNGWSRPSGLSSMGRTTTCILAVIPEPGND